jgi:hypothetical protein
MTDVNEHLIGHLKGRAIEGNNKYGVPLTAFNGRNPLKDKREELLDALVYNEQDIMEREALVAFLGKVATFIEMIADQLANSPEEVISEIRNVQSLLRQDIRRIEPEPVLHLPDMDDPITLLNAKHDPVAGEGRVIGTQPFPIPWGVPGGVCSCGCGERT